jgi:hypothetical protein
MDDVDGLVDEIVLAFRHRLIEVGRQMGEARDPRAFVATERELLQMARELAAEMTGRILQQISDDKERRKEALAAVREKADTRGIEVRTERDRVTPVRTLGGQTVRIKTAYASSRPRGGKKLAKRGKDGTGVYPVLDQLGIVGRSTPALRLLVSRAVCEANSVDSARDLLAEGGVVIDHKAALRLTYLVTDDALRARRKAMRAQQRGCDDGPFAGRRVVAAVDGGRVNIRRRVAGRPRKGGRKHFETEWREPKILTLYVLDEEGRRDRSVPTVIDGTLGDADAVFELLRYHLLRMGAHQAASLVFVADGAKWIWNRTDDLRASLGLPKDRFQEIVDYFHVVERLTELSRTQSRWGEDLRVEWLHEQKRRLKAGDIEAIEDVVRVIGTRKDADMETESEYWARNRERLRYGSFRDEKWPIGSGAVESAVRRVINLRMKGASITWTEEHAEGILHLRAHAKSGRWDELENNVLDITGWRPSARSPRHAA